MHITKIELINVRCYDHLVIDLGSGKDNVKWATILGDNGTGKSTLLKSIAIGVCDETSAAGLLREVPWIFRNKEKKSDPAIINIHVRIVRTDYKIVTKIKKLYGKEIEKIDRSIENLSKGTSVTDDRFRWDKILLCGYGASRSAEGTADYLKYSIVDAVYTLFRYDQPLQNPELAMRRYIQRTKEINKKDENDTLIWLNEILDPILLLNAKKEKITLEDDGIWIISNKWGKTPLAATGDGYKATLTWVMDFISWASYYYEKGLIDQTIEGIILIDEIEQHLHPNWQREIVGILRRTFPNVQFISTTHSPLVTINTVKVDNSGISKLFYLKWHSTGEVGISEVQEQLSDIGMDQVLGSEAFGHIYELNPNIEDVLREMSELASLDSPNDNQKQKLDKIKSELKKIMFPKGVSLIERVVEREYYQELEEKADYMKKFMK